MPRALIAEDHPTMRTGLRAVLDMAGIEVIGEATDFDSAIKATGDLKPDVLITDFGMQGNAVCDGETYLATLRESFPDVPVVVITMVNRPVQLRAILGANVPGLVDKTAPLSEISLAVRRVLDGRRYVSPSFQLLLDEAEADSGSHLALSPREHEVLALLAKGLTMMRIAEHLGRAPNTVSAQKRSMMRKLKLKNDNDLADYLARLSATP